jgi:hypothetical protein
MRDTASGANRSAKPSASPFSNSSRRLVMHYFGSKQELYRRVIDTAPVPEVSGTPADAAEQILAGLASRLTSEPVASLALFRSMLTNPEAASAATLGITVSRHLIKSDVLATADPAQVIELLRPCMQSLAACPDQGGHG